jgi:hypothetical protein
MVAATMKCGLGDPVLEEFNRDASNKEKKKKLRRYFIDILAHTIGTKGYEKTVRFPWKKLAENPQKYILAGSLPGGFRFNNPEDLRVDEIAELWVHIHRRQQQGRLIGFCFTEEIYDLLGLSRGTDTAQAIGSAEAEPLTLIPIEMDDFDDDFGAQTILS